VGLALDDGEEPPTLGSTLSRGRKVPAVITIRQWTGREATLLRTALRLSIRDFAVKLGVDTRTVTKWGARGAEVVLRPHMQEVMDTLLRQADEHAQARFADILREDGGQPGLYSHPHQSGSVRDVDRYQFLRTSGAVLALPWMELFGPTRPAAVPVRISTADIEKVHAASSAFSSMFNAYGGAPTLEAVFAQLRWSAQLLRADCPEALRSDLFAAVARLADVAGSHADDLDAFEDAGRAFRFGLACAEQSGNWQARSELLGDLALLALWTGRLDDGLTHADKALAHADRLPAVHRAKLQTIRARVLAKLHRPQEALATVGSSDDALADESFVNEPLRWTGPHDHILHQARTGEALFDLAIAGKHTEASRRLAYTVAHDGRGYGRWRAIARIKYATLLMATSDPHEAAAVGNKAVDEAGAVRSRRVVNDLRTLQRFAGRHPRIIEAVELRGRIGEMVEAT